MYRNYTTSNIFDCNNYKNDYSYKTCNTSFLDDDSFEIQPYGKDKYNDEDLDNKSTMFFSTMDSFYSQKKELEEVDNETDYTINEMNRYYDNKRSNFINKFNKRRKEIVDDYSNTIGKYNDFRRIFKKKMKTEEMDNQLDNASKSFLGYIEKKRNDESRKYRNQRAAVYNRIKIQHENFWKKRDNLKYLDYK